MKKIIALVMVVAVLLGAVAVAENAQVKTISWADHEAETKDVAGQFANIGNTGIMVYMPSTWEDVKITEEQTNQLVTLRTANIAETDPNYCVLSGQVLPVPLASFKAALQEKTPATLEDAKLNGADVITYTVEANGVKAIGVAYSTTDDAQTISFTFAPVTDANEKLVTMMVASLQAAK